MEKLIRWAKAKTFAELCVSDFRNRELVPALIRPDGVTVGWIMKVPGGGRMESTELYEIRNQIVIKGDLCPRRNGLISDLGYDLRWFSGNLGEGYLCEKFLSREWSHESAALWCLKEARNISRSPKNTIFPLPDWASARENPKGREEMARLIQGLRDVARDLDTEDDVEDFIGMVNDATDHPGFRLIVDEIPGYSYPIHEAALLCAIQKRFSELVKNKDLQNVSGAKE